MSATEGGVKGWVGLANTDSTYQKANMAHKLSLLIFSTKNMKKKFFSSSSNCVFSSHFLVILVEGGRTNADKAHKAICGGLSKY